MRERYAPCGRVGFAVVSADPGDLRALTTDKPMLYYPLQTLMDAGIQDILVVTGSNDAEISEVEADGQYRCSKK